MRANLFVFTLLAFLFSELKILCQELEDTTKFVNSNSSQLGREECFMEFSKHFNGVEQSTVYIFGFKLDKSNDFFKDFFKDTKNYESFYQRRKNISETGFLVDKYGMILTGSQNVKDADSIFVKFSDRKVVRGEVAKVDTILDLALLKASIDTVTSQLVPFGNGYETKTGDFVMGFDKSSNDFLLHMFQAAGVDKYIYSNEGSLLGPTFNSKGEFIGILCHPKSDGGNRLNGIVPSNIIERLLRQWGIAIEIADKEGAKQWAATVKANTIEAYEDFLKKYPFSSFDSIALKNYEKYFPSVYKDLRLNMEMDLVSIRKLASVDNGFGMILESNAEFAFGKTIYGYEIQGRGMSYEEYLDKLYKLASNGEYNKSTIINNVFERDTKIDYRKFIDIIQKAKDKKGITDQLERYLWVAKWRLEILEKSDAEKSFDIELPKAVTKMQIYKVIDMYSDYWQLVKKAREKLENILIEEAYKPKHKPEFVLPDILPIEGSHSARVTVLENGTEEFGLLQAEYPNDELPPVDHAGMTTYPLGNGSVHRYKGKSECLVQHVVTSLKYTFIGEKDDPLTFLLLKKVGYVYLHGSGTIIFPDGMKRTIKDIHKK